MTISSDVAGRVILGVCILVGLLFGGYLLGSTRAVSTTPMYITDASNSNAASVDSLNRLSVHIADPSLPVSSGPQDSVRIQFPVSQGLKFGQCYEAFVRGTGAFMSASLVDEPGTGAGRPESLVRLDRSVVWFEDGSSSSTPHTQASGVTTSGNATVFGFDYTLQFKAFAGVDVCRHSSGTSDKFSVQLTVAGLQSIDLYPEIVRFTVHSGPSGHSFFWSHQWIQTPGLTPTSFRVVGTNSTEVEYYRYLSSAIQYGGENKSYSASVSGALPSRFYLFELQARTDPTRVGPFGSWRGL